MDDLHAVGLRPAVHRGPRRGHSEQVVLVVPAHAPVDEDTMFHAYSGTISALPFVKEVIQTSPRRGKPASRQSVFMTIRFKRGVSAERAVALVKRAVADRIKRFARITPVVRQERRAKKAAKRAAQRQRRLAAQLEMLCNPTPA